VVLPGNLGGNREKQTSELYYREKPAYAIQLLYILIPQLEIKVTLQEVKDILDAEVIVGHDRLGLEVKKAGCADLMTDVLLFGKKGMLLLTGLTSTNVIHTADVLGLAAIVMVRGKRPTPEMIQLAKELQIPILVTEYILFESVGRLYVKGIVGITEK
jgi:predicted transcriptional regulator